jgi:hypothetical protein
MPDANTSKPDKYANIPGIPKLTDAQLQRFWSRVDKTDSCWVWRNAPAPGYGTIGFGGRNFMAHRVSWELTHGPIPRGLVVDHLCRNPSCVNPAHLECVRQRENVIRGIGPASRALATHCQRGHEFTPSNTSWIRNKWGRVRKCRQCKNERRRIGYVGD